MNHDDAHEVLKFAWTLEQGADTMFAYLSPMIRAMHEPPIECREFVPDELAELVPVLQETISRLADVLEIVVSDRRADPRQKEIVTAGLDLIRQGDQKVRAGRTLYGKAPPLARFLSAKVTVDFPTGPSAGFAPSASTGDPGPRSRRGIRGARRAQQRRMWRR